MREPGYYWVRIDDWFIAEWSGTIWESMGDCHWYESDFAEIDERRIVREVPSTILGMIVGDHEPG